MLVMKDQSDKKSKRTPVRFDRAKRILRQQILNAGDDWEQIVPFRYGESLKVFRVNMEQEYVEKGWLRQNHKGSGQPEDTARVVDYLLNRKMSDDIRSENYAFMPPELVFGAVDLMKASDACAAIEEKRDRNTAAAVDKIAAGLGVGQRHLRAV